MYCHLLCFCLALSVLPSKDDRPELAVGLIPQELRKDAYTVIRESVTTFEISSPKAYIHRVKETVSILDRRSGYDVLHVGYDKYSKAKILSAEIYDDAGTLIRKIRKQDIRDVSLFDGISLYSDNRALIVDLPGGRLPYSVAYEYEVSYSATMMYPPWVPQEYHTSVENAELHVYHPRGQQIHAVESNLPAASVKQKTDGIPVHQFWKFEHLQAIASVPYAPPALEVFPLVFLAPDRFEVEGYTGSMSDWKRFGHFIHELNQDRHKLTPGMAQIVRSLVSDAAGNQEKIDILYTYLKNNTRYVSVQLGIGGWQAYPAGYVENNKYGDCKALSYFMKGMLDEAGINAYPVLIGWDRPSFMKDETATPFFNHMMLYIPEHEIWLECTSSNNPTGYIHDGTSDRDVLLITPEGGVRSRTPAETIEQSSVFTSDSLSMVNGVWHLSGSRVFTGREHDYYRDILTYLSVSEQQKRFRESMDLSIQSFGALDYVADPDKPRAECHYRMELAQYGSVSGPRLFLPVNPMYRYQSICKSGPRQLDVYHDLYINEENTVHLILPEGYQIEGLPEPRTIEDPRFGSYAQVVESEGTHIRVHRRLLLKRLRLPAEAYADLCAFYREVEKADRNLLVLRRIGP